MLRITIHEHDGSWRMQLEGKLAGECVAEAERAWRSAPAGKRIKVDLSGLLAVDPAGRKLLAELSQAGAAFEANGVATRAMVEGLGNCSPDQCLWKKPS